MDKELDQTLKNFEQIRNYKGFYTGICSLKIRYEASWVCSYYEKGKRFAI